MRAIPSEEIMAKLAAQQLLRSSKSPEEYNTRIGGIQEHFSVITTPEQSAVADGNNIRLFYPTSRSQAALHKRRHRSNVTGNCSRTSGLETSINQSDGPVTNSSGTVSGGVKETDLHLQQVVKRDAQIEDYRDYNNTGVKFPSVHTENVVNICT